MSAASPAPVASAERSIGMNAKAAIRTKARITAHGDSRFLRGGGTSSMGRGHSKSYSSFKSHGNLAGKALDYFFGFRFHHHSRQ